MDQKIYDKNVKFSNKNKSFIFNEKVEVIKYKIKIRGIVYILLLDMLEIKIMQTSKNKKGKKSLKILISKKGKMLEHIDNDKEYQNWS